MNVSILKMMNKNKKWGKRMPKKFDKKHINFAEMIYDAGEPLPRVSADQAAAMLNSKNIDEYDRKLITSVVAELVHTAEMFKTIRQRPKVTIFGSARTKPDHPDYQTCKEFAHQLAQLGYMVITGAGPGIMAAGHEGAGPENSIGSINPFDAASIAPFREISLTG